jgi:hypothetical protein
MARLHLNFYQRVTLWNLIGGYQAPNMRATLAFLELLKKIRPSDEELRDAQFRLEGAQYHWQQPYISFGEIDLQLGNEEAEALAQALEAQQAVKVADALWMFPILDELKQEKVVAAS